jgi:hypothetical protein
MDQGDWLFKIAPWFFGFCFLMVLGSFIAYGFIAYEAVSHPHEIAEGAGKLAHDFWSAAKGERDARHQ